MEYRRTARAYWMSYAALSVGAFLAITPFFLSLPSWLRASCIAVGLLFFLAAGLAIVRNRQFGSRLDLASYELIWWEGYPPSDEARISLDRLRTILLEVHSGDLRLKLLDADGERIGFTEKCAPSPWPEWAAKMKANVPHIEILEK